MKYVLKIFPALLVLSITLTACSPEQITDLQQTLKNKPPAASPQTSMGPPPQPTTYPKPSSAAVVTDTIAPPSAPSTTPTTVNSEAPSTTPLPQATASDDFICFPNAGETVHGKILDSTGLPVAGVKIVLKLIEPEVIPRCPQRVLSTTFTNTDGSYTFSQGVIGGVRMELEVSRAGFLSQTTQLVPITNRAGDAINRYDFSLRSENKLTP